VKKFELSALVAQMIERKDVDESMSRSVYKKAKKQYIAELVDDKMLANIATYFTEYQRAITVQRIDGEKYSHTDVAPSITDSMSAAQKKIAYLPYNNGRRISLFKKSELITEIALQNLSIKSLKKIMDALLERYMDSLRTKYPGDIVVTAVHDTIKDALGIPDELTANVGQIIYGLKYAGVIGMEKVNSVTDAKNNMWMVSVNFTDYLELYELRRMTAKHYSRLLIDDDIDENSFIISQRKWRYDQPTLVDGIIDTMNKQRQTRFEFADYVDREHIREAVLKSILPDSEYTALLRERILESDVDVGNDFNGKQVGLSAEYEWAKVEVRFALMEYDRIMLHGGAFYIDRFVDGANRIYEKRTYFGFQGTKEFRQIIRFRNKEVVTEEGRQAYLNAYCSINGIDKAYFSAEHALEEYGDAWGYLHAYTNPEVPTGAIVFQDATSQGTQLYGVATGSESLLRQGGAWNLADSTLIKAYVMLAAELNDALGAWWITEQYKTKPDTADWEIKVFDCFTSDNVKSINMTKLYNVGKERILTGKGFAASKTDEEMTEILNIIEYDEEYESDLSKLGRLRPLMMTAREAGLTISKEDMWKIFDKAIWKIASPALVAMDRINTIVKELDKTEVFEWKSLDDVNNVYAMVAHKEESVNWITELGAVHSYTHKFKVLEAGSSWRGVAPRVIQSTDGFLVRYVTNDNDFDIVTIHDSFGSHGNDAKAVKQSYNNGLVELFDKDYLTDILCQFMCRKVKSLQPQDEETRSKIVMNLRNATHALDWA